MSSSSSLSSSSLSYSHISNRNRLFFTILPHKDTPLASYYYHRYAHIVPFTNEYQQFLAIVGETLELPNLNKDSVRIYLEQNSIQSSSLQIGKTQESQLPKEFPHYSVDSTLGRLGGEVTADAWELIRPSDRLFVELAPNIFDQINQKLSNGNGQMYSKKTTLSTSSPPALLSSTCSVLWSHNGSPLSAYTNSLLTSYIKSPHTFHLTPSDFNVNTEEAMTDHNIPASSLLPSPPLLSEMDQLRQQLQQLSKQLSFLYKDKSKEKRKSEERRKHRGATLNGKSLDNTQAELERERKRTRRETSPVRDEIIKAPIPKANTSAASTSEATERKANETIELDYVDPLNQNRIPSETAKSNSSNDFPSQGVSLLANPNGSTPVQISVLTSSSGSIILDELSPSFRSIGFSAESSTIGSNHLNLNPLPDKTSIPSNTVSSSSLPPRTPFPKQNGHTITHNEVSSSDPILIDDLPPLEPEPNQLLQIRATENAALTKEPNSLLATVQLPMSSSIPQAVSAFISLQDKRHTNHLTAEALERHSPSLNTINRQSITLTASSLSAQQRGVVRNYLHQKHPHNDIASAILSNSVEASEVSPSSSSTLSSPTPASSLFPVSQQPIQSNGTVKDLQATTKNINDLRIGLGSITNGRLPVNSAAASPPSPPPPYPESQASPGCSTPAVSSSVGVDRIAIAVSTSSTPPPPSAPLPLPLSRPFPVPSANDRSTEISVRDPTGKTVHFRVHKTKPLRKMKEAYINRTSIESRKLLPGGKVLFTWKGREIDDHDTVTGLGLEYKDLVDVNVAMTKELINPQ